MAKNRIAELREQEFNRQMEELLFNHQQQREECEQAHIKQYQEFNQHWDSELQLAQEEDQNEIINLENRHTHELEENRKTLEEKLPTNFKFSAELLNLRRIQANLAKQKNYQEAHDVQTRAQELEDKEAEAYGLARHKKILANESKLMTKQQNEMNALKKKLEGRMNERLKLREVEHNKILQRYQNVKKEIENQQNLERIKTEKAYKVRPQTASSRSQMKTSTLNASKMGRSTLSKQATPASKPSHQ